MDFTLSPQIEALRLRVRAFVEEHVLPLEADRENFSEHENIPEPRLAKVRERPLTKNVAQFSLTFHGPADAPLAAGIHSLRHPALGSFSAFVSAISIPNGERRVYQACFSRFLRT